MRENLLKFNSLFVANGLTERLLSIVNMQTELVFRILPDLTLSFVNIPFCRLLNESGENLVNQSLTNFISPETTQNLRALVDKVLQTQQAHSEEVNWQIGEQRHWLYCNLVPVSVAYQEVIELQINAYDITNFKKSERILKKAKRRAEQNADAKMQFLSTMSHEIRTPMNSVIALTHLLLQENPRPDQIQALNTLKFSAENLLTLINDILDFNKIEAGKLVFEEADFVLTELIEAIVEGLQYKAHEKSIEIRINIDPKINPVLVGDSVRISQILTNLIDNAIKFTPQGYVSIDVALNQEEGEFEIIDFAVNDTGIGIESDKLNEIFNSFTQAESDTTRKFGGTGLGLSITKNLLELQNSTIQVVSKVGIGSKFYFKLRLRKGNPSRITTAEQLILVDYTQYNLHQANILLVEDNELNRLVAAQFLHKWNAALDFALNGLEAIEMVQKNEYDVVLMDLQMPIMDGYKSATLIRQLGKKYQDLPIIALTASAMAEVKHKVRQAGMNDYLTKPFNPQDLYTKITRNLKTNMTLNTNTLEMNFQKTHDTLLLMISPENINYKKVIEISNGNKAFIKRYNELAIKMFEDLSTEYALALRTKDAEKLRKLAHNIRATIQLLEVKAIESEIEHGKLLLQNTATTPQQINESIVWIKEAAKIMINFLQSKLQG
ncbi:MAG: response regulator [Microscillaceae bacterium]|jgi:signal transduction histidine kinase/DNA-binding NarL/FixJ family response regulator|nr:response regulator [Microscillaceae bacterium]